jgi:hypothetical protein
MDSTPPEILFAARVAPLLDAAFGSAQEYVAEHGGKDLVRGFGAPAAALITFRTALGWPGRWVTRAQSDEVARYGDPAERWASIETAAADGFLELDGDELDGDRFRAAARGAEFLAALAGLQDRLMGRRWAGLDDTVARATGVFGRLLDAAAETGGPTYHTMAPPYETGAGPGVLLVNRMGTFRYHRADAHAAAWRAAGLTAAQIVALISGPERERIEAETNRLAAPPFGVLASPERAALLEDLATLAVSS